MKSGFICFRNVCEPLDSGIGRVVSEVFASAGFYLDEITHLPDNDEQAFVNKLNEYKDVFDNIVICDSPNLQFDMKEAFAECMQVELVPNQTAKQRVEAYFASKGMRPSCNAEELMLLPEGATVLPNTLGYVQGYMVEDDDVSIIVLPGGTAECEEMCRQYVVPYMQSKFSIQYERASFKLFGADRAETEEVIRQALKRTKRTVSFQLTERYADCKLDVIYDSKSPKTVVDDVLRFLANELSGYIYAAEDISLEQCASQLLRMRGKKIAVSESFTGGNIAARLISLSGASEILYESVVAYDNGSKMSRLGVSPNTLQSHGAVSSQTAYEMAAGLLTGGSADVVVSTTGIAGPNSDNTAKPVGLCYIAVGTSDGIHVYKYRLCGDRETITQTATNAALYLICKNIKQI